MKNNFKKVFTVVLSLLLCATTCFTACKNQENEDGDLVVATGTPEYADDKAMGLIGYAMPTYKAGDDAYNEESVKKIKEAGFTGMFIDSWSGPKMNTPEFSQLLGWFDKYGLDAYLSLNNGWQNRGNGTHAPDSTYDYTWKKLESITVDYSVFDCFKGVNIFDEPGGVNGNSVNEAINDFNFIQSQYEYWKTMWDENSENYVFSKGEYTDYLFFVNGCGDFNNVYKPLTQKIYPKLANKHVSYDYYFMDYDVRNDKAFFQDMNLFHLGNYATSAKELNAPLWVYTETYSTQSGTKRGDKGLFNREDILFQNNLYMTFGCKNIEYFVYGTAAGYVGLTNSMGGETATYNTVKTINAEISAWDHIFLSFDWQGTMAVVGSKNTNGAPSDFENFVTGALESSPRIDSVQASRNTLIGCFKDANNFDGFYVTNYSDPFYDRSDEVSITFKKATRAMECYNGKVTEVQLKNGVYSKTLKAGEGVFVIPLV